ncbi:CCA tRNA nucleotidyltransferase [Sulfurimonas sp. C5]|uniref:CCA tRNA nucleotidyltransferase n=1 Tax=Sulfurimonas sp. C5 TaxID=3036947 RepID=UPI002455F5A0|nr:CCA tRNA nucleotidyltransferase [Sulfurimonas sp. C5]MDH4944872.1 CCA tRNA nucleotidyltransferase [Sulfurimonas sp. C5]
MQKIQYPIILNIIFEKLNLFGIKPVIIGGYIRDHLLQNDSKDIDIELYNVENIDQVEDILKEFGSVNEVGKAFCVIKLNIEDLDLDFSLPRIDSKIGSGHRGFKITTDSHLDFKTATSRRDFTINAVGYDVIEHKLLDPFGGIEDLTNKQLKAVDLNKFAEDPLRVFRAIQFASRFELEIDEKLLHLCKIMVDNNQLNFLSKERIFAEIEKLLLKSKNPSSGFIFLKNIGLFKMFVEFNTLSHEEFIEVITLLDNYKRSSEFTNKLSLITMFVILTSKFQIRDIEIFLHRLTDDKEIIHKVLNIHNFIRTPSYTLSMRIDKKVLESYLQSIQMKNYKAFMDMVEPKIKGKDLIAQGIKPSVEFSEILEEKYQKQIKGYLS